MKNRFSRRRKVIAVWALAAAALATSPLLLHSSKPIPAGFDIEAAPVPTAPENIRLFIDDTAWDPTVGKRVHRQEIFDELLGSTVSFPRSWPRP